MIEGFKNPEGDEVQNGDHGKKLQKNEWVEVAVGWMRQALNQVAAFNGLLVLGFVVW
ncbi:hypothetical protein GCM10022277_42030 [Litoribacillus peritrichatus]|uniref:Uncharacterized protein n=1 Tax=Litoribacillus peritrichatus TaxID=718191 RepID=A0ABP7NBD2_9GAMM